VSAATIERDTEVTSSGWQLPSWGKESACRQEDPEQYFPENGRPSKKLLEPCNTAAGGCPVKAQCLEFALNGPWMPYGPWGGLPQSEVQAMWLTRHPRDRSDEDGVLAALGLV
jgi:ribonuclease I